VAQSNIAPEKPGRAELNRRLPEFSLIALGLCVFYLAYLLAGAQVKGLWLPAVGIGIAFTAWIGYRILPFFALTALIANYLLYRSFSEGALRQVLDALFVPAQVGLGWWVYHRLAGGSKRLDDPRSATLFLIVVPGLVEGLLAIVQVSLWQLVSSGQSASWVQQVSSQWIGLALGTLIPVPVFLVVVSPWLVRHRWIKPDPPGRVPGGSMPQDWTWGEMIETFGLLVGNCIFSAVLVLTQRDQGFPHWTLWGIALLIVVWGSLRQGLRGGTLIAGAGAALALSVAHALGMTSADFSPLQGNLLAQCSTALLVGASSGWIRASEARYRQVVGHIPVVLYSVHLPRGLRVTAAHLPNKHPTKPDADPDVATGPLVVQQAEITLVSYAARQVFGCDADDLLGPYRDWLLRILPADRELVTAAVAQLCLQKEPVTCEYRLDPTVVRPAEKLSGSWASVEVHRWVRDTLAPNYTTDGLLAGWEGVIEDITEQQALALRLKRTSNMLQALVSNLPMGIFFVQGQLGQPILVNARARQLLGQREDRAAGVAYLSQVYRLHRPDGSLYPADELPVTKALRLGTSHMVSDIVIHHPDGRRVPLITWAAPVDLTGTGKPDAAVWVLEDSSALQQAESARRDSENRLRQALEVLRQSKEKYQNLVENLPLVVLQLDGEGRIIFLNSAAEQITGYTTKELERPGFWESLLHKDDQPQFGIALQRSRAGYHARVEIRYRAKDGSNRIGHALLQPLLHEGKVLGSTCLIVDMTLQRFLETELQRAQQLELVGRIASGTVHDFNNLLTVMVGLANMAQMQLEPNNPAQEPLLRIQEAGEQAGHLAGQILTFSKQRHVTEGGTVNLNTVVLHSLRMLHSIFPPNMRVETDLAGDDPRIKAEETQLKQVIINLCLNARDAMPQGGKIVVRTDAAEMPNGDVSGKRLIRLTVQDSGRGMDEAVLAHIFEPFFTTKELGTGLGLTVVRQIVESFGGRIQASSQPDQGTRMEVFFDEASKSS